jgi:hypothetical protein
MKRKILAGTPFLNVHIPSWIGAIENIIAPTNLSAARMRLLLHNFYLCHIGTFIKRDKAKYPWADQGYFPVYWLILKEVGTDNYSAYIKVLEDARIIERRRNTIGGKNYLPGVHSQLYRFILPEQMSYPRYRIERITDYRCMKSALRVRDRYALGEYDDGKHIAMNTTHEMLRKYVKLAKIDCAIVGQIMRDANSDPEHDDYSSLYIDYLDSINEGVLGWFKIDQFGERCHTPFTNLKSEYRKAIRFLGHEDQSLVSIDIRNSQPYFSAAICNGSLLDELLPEFWALKPLVSALSNAPDFVSYKELCTSGLLYDHIAKLMGDKTREEIKQQFFRAVLFSKKRLYGEDRVMAEIFRKAFPSVYRFFKAIKKLNESDLPSLESIIKERKGKYYKTNNSHKILSCAMQRLEARLLTQYVADRLSAAGVAPFLTIHDNYLVLPEHQAICIETIYAAFRSFNIDPPQLSVQVL